jgi:hypothetical protein|tara:strand:+ start:1621 stop:3000 length:1380 start_codon:yes stop_codon:yes gene_type:complete
MPNLTSGDEQKLLEGVKQAVHYVDDNGMSPNEALAKVAKDMSLTPGFMRAAVSAFNNGRQVSQWRANDSVLDKLAGFPIADYDKIHADIWGGTEKEAKDKYMSLGDEVHSDYQKAPQWAKRDDLSKLATMDLGIEKLAEDEVPEHVQAHEKTKVVTAAWNTYSRAKRVCDETRTKEAAAKDALTMRLAILTNYFKKFARDRLPFDVVEKAACSYYGVNGVALMDVMADRFPTEKRAADTKRYWEKPLSRDAEPFTFIQNTIKAAAALSIATDESMLAKQAREEAKGALLPFVPAPTQPKSEKDTTFSISLINGGDGEKEAGLVPAMLVGDKLSRSIGSDDAAEREISKVEHKLNAPDHSDELRRIKAQVMLAEMLGDPENPISEYPPEEVMARYNELAQLAPRISEQSAAMQPLLAKRLAGQTEPFEIKEIGEIEKGLKDTSEESKIDLLKQSNDSILS